MRKWFSHGEMFLGSIKRWFLMARNVLSFSEMAAFSAFCLAHGLDTQSVESHKRWKASLVAADGSVSSGKRGRQKGAKALAFIYDGEGNVLGSATCLDNDAGRMGLGASAIQTHGAKIESILYTKSFVGEKPRLVSIVTEDGRLVRGYAMGREVNARTGEESVSSDDSDETEEQTAAE